MTDSLNWLVDRFLPVQIVREIAERHGFGRIHAKRCGKWVGDYLAKYLTKEVRAACLKGKHLWAAFGEAKRCRVKDINVRSWLGDEYRRIRAGAVGISRQRSYGILQRALRNYALWVDQADGIVVWLPENEVGTPFLCFLRGSKGGLIRNGQQNGELRAL